MASEPPPINTLTLSEQVRQHLAHLIENGTLRPGQPLRMQGLCEEYGWTMAPVREALRALASEGLVSYVSHCGYRVPEIVRDEIQALYQVREVLEGLAARLLATRITDEQLAALCEAAPRESPEYPDNGRIGYSPGHKDVEFHRQIAEWCGNPFMPQLLLAPRVLARSVPTPFGVKPLPMDLEFGHDLIVEALGRRDPNAAEKAMKAHIREAGERAALAAELSEGADSHPVDQDLIHTDDATPGRAPT